MSKRIRQIVIFCMIVGTIAAVKWIADPARSRAFLAPSLTTPATMIPHVLPAVPLPAPKVSIVFVIDSSSNMQPRVGRNYFEMAREGIVKFLKREGFRDDGTFEISVIQYAKENVPGYVEGLPGQTGTYHWFGPVHVVSDSDLSHEDCNNTNRCASKDQVIDLALGLEHTKHFTGMLLESGLNEARKIAEEAHAGASQVHVILLSTGEYRLPKPWPHENYCVEAPCPTQPKCDQLYNPSSEATKFPGYRACHVRHYANALRNTRNGQVFLSAVHLGPNFRDANNTYGIGAEIEAPYGTTPYYCVDPDTQEPGAREKQPDRAGFLKELCNWKSDDSESASDTSNEKCNPDQRLGKYVRINPDLAFTPLGPEGTVFDIERSIAKWMCEWMALRPYDASQNSDGDFFNPNHSSPIPIYDICDNCMHLPNPRQRDCNLDGIGDLCQAGTDACISSQTHTMTGDVDCDGLCDALDLCEGGDNCLINYWRNQKGCGDLPSSAACNCNCDNHPSPDLCAAAIRFAGETLDPPTECTEGLAFDTPDTNGIPDLAEGTDPTVVPIPASCDIEAVLCCDPEVSEYGAYFADFNVAPPAGQSHITYLENRGWSLSDPDAAARLTINPTATFTGCQIKSNEGYLSVASSASIATDPYWYLSTKSFTFPRPEACEAADALSGAVCLHGGCPLIGRWSYLAVDLELYVDNRDSSDFVVEVLNGCSHNSFARALLRFEDNADDGDGGAIYFVQSACAPACDVNIASYQHEKWQRLRFLFDNTARRTIPYPVESPPCVVGEYAPSLKVIHQLWNACGTIARKGPYFESYYAPGQPVGSPFELPGIQVRFRFSNVDGPDVRIGAISIRPTDACEFNYAQVQEDSCPGGYCNCSNPNVDGWQCDSGTSCVDWGSCVEGPECDAE